MHRIFRDDVKDPRVFVRGGAKCRQSCRGVVKQVFRLVYIQSSTHGDQFKINEPTVMVVPSLPAHGLGSEVRPGFGATRFPSA